MPAATSRSTRLSTARFDGAAARTFSPLAAARRISSTRTVVFPVPGGPCTSIRSLARSACRSEEHTSELQSQSNLVCRLLLEKKKNQQPAVLGSDWNTRLSADISPRLLGA